MRTEVVGRLPDCRITPPDCWRSGEKLGGGSVSKGVGNVNDKCPRRRHLGGWRA